MKRRVFNPEFRQSEPERAFWTGPDWAGNSCFAWEGDIGPGDVRILSKKWEGLKPIVLSSLRASIQEDDYGIQITSMIIGGRDQVVFDIPLAMFHRHALGTRLTLPSIQPKDIVELSIKNNNSVVRSYRIAMGP